ncbi:MAG: SdrD B-like domain-containing protein, partial [Gammaproteobacteria bacterium]
MEIIKKIAALFSTIHLENQKPEKQKKMLSVKMSTSILLLGLWQSHLVYAGLPICYAMPDNDLKLYVTVPDPGASPAPGGTPVVLSPAPDSGSSFVGEGAAYRAVDGFVYAFDCPSDDQGPADLWRIDVATGATTRILDDIINNSNSTGEACVDGAVFYTDAALGQEIFYVIGDQLSNSSRKLYAFDPTNNFTAIAGYPKDFFGDRTNLDSMDYDPVAQKFYGADDGGADIYEINVATGELTSVSTTSSFIDGESMGYAADNIVYVENESGSDVNIYALNPATGNLTLAANFNVASADIETIACNGGERDDMSDAPSSYGIAVHSIPVFDITPSPAHMGTTQGDDDFLVSAASNNADSDGSGDDDGVTLSGSTLQGSTVNVDATITIDIVTNGQNNGFLNAWIDFNGNGNFNDPGEQIATDVAGTTGGSINLSVSIPSGATLGNTFARFRYSTQTGLASSDTNGDQAIDGEVEDYAITIAAALPPSQFTCNTTGFLQFFERVPNSGNFEIGELDLVTGNYNTQFTFTKQLNALGYSISDNYLYGAEINGSKNLHRVDADGNLIDLGVTLPNNIFAGDVDNNNVWHGFRNTQVFKIDINALTLTTTAISDVTDVADFAFSNFHSLFFGVKSNADGSVKDLYTYNPNTNAVTITSLSGDILTVGGGAFGATWADVNGSVFTSHNASGKVFVVDIATGNTTELILSVANIKKNDGMSCSLAAGPALPANITLAKALTAETGSVSGVVEAGETLTYTITLSNSGGTDGTITIDETVPAGTTFVAAGNDFTTATCIDGAAAASVCSLTSPNVPGGSSATMTFKVLAASPMTTTSVDNLVIENGDTPPTCTSADSSDARCVSTPAEAGITLAKALTAESGSSVGVVEADETLTYTITLNNAGGSDGTITIDETVPAGTTFVEAGNDFTTATCVDGAAAATVCSLTSPNVPAGGSATMAFKILAANPMTTTSVDNRVIENGDTPPTCTSADSSDARCVSTPAEAGITISKALTTESGSTANVVEAGETLTYTITLNNAGGTDGTITIDETVPAGTTFVATGNDFVTAICVDGAAAATVCSLTSPNIPAGGSASMTFKVQAANPMTTASVENLAIENGDTPPTCTSADSSDARCVSTPAEAGITISKALTTESGSVTNVVEAGETLTYTVTLSNSGGSDGTIIIDEKVPTGTTFIATGNDFSTATCVDNAIAGTVCSLTSPNVPANGSATMIFKVLAANPMTTTSIENLVIENGTVPPTCTAADSNDTRCVSTPAEESITITKVLSAEDGSITGVVEAGETLVYTITLTNNGGSDSSIIIDETVPEGTTFIAGSNDFITGVCIDGAVAATVCSLTSPNIPAGSSATMNFKVKALNPLTTTGVENLVIENGSTPPTCTVTDSSDARCVSTPTEAGISIIKSLNTITDTNSDSVTNAGDTITYSFTVTNTGGLVLNPIAVSDTKIATVTCVDTTLAVGANTSCSGNYVISAADMTAGGVENIATATGTPKNPNGSDGTPVTDLSDAGTAPDGSTVANPKTVETPNPLGVNSNNAADPTDDPTTVLLTPTGVIAGTIYEDTNGNNTQDPGEPGIENVTVNITDINNNPRVLTTDNNGNYAAQVPAGNTVVDVDETTLPSGFTQTEGTEPTTVSVPAGGIGNDVDGYQPPANAGTVDGIVYQDTNGSNTQDPGEPGITGVTVTITDSSSGTQTLTTDSNGAYSATVPAGSTLIDIDDTSLPGGSTQTEGTDTTTLTVPAGGTVSDVDGYQPPANAGTIEGIVYQDTNGNNSQDSGEPGIIGVSVTITDSSGGTQLLTTDSNGAYSATVPAGSTLIDIDDASLPGGVTQTEGTDSTTLTVPAGGTASDVDGYQPSADQGTLEGVVYEDTNGNATQDSGEPGIAGVNVTVTDSKSSIQTLVTDANGEYRTTVPAGATLVDIEQSNIDASFTHTEGTDPTTVTVPAGGIGRDVDGFHPPPTGVVAGTVYEDTNGNSIQDPGEPGIQNVTVNITDINATAYVLTTDNNGNYATQVPAGNTLIDIDETTLPSGFIKTQGSEPTSILVLAGDIGSDVDGYQPPANAGTVDGIVYEDTNGNSSQDAGEPGLAGVTVTITDSSNGTQTLITDNTGAYSATVPAGSTVIDIEDTSLPGGSTQTEGADTTTLTVPAGGSVSDIDGYQPPANAGTVNGIVYNDLNGNGSQDSGEPGIAGVTVTITDSGSGIQTLTTDSNGAYSTTVPAGSTIIDIEETSLPGGSTQTQGTDSTTLTVPAGGSASDIDGYKPSAAQGTLEGVVYADTNGNATQDSGEPGIAGVNVTVTDSESNIQTLVTDSNGEYSTVVPAGTTLVDIEQSDIDASFTHTEGTDPTTVTVPVNGIGRDVDGFHPPVAGIQGTVWLDADKDGQIDSGEPRLPNWTLVVRDTSGTEKARTTTDGNGDYSVTGLTPATYTVDFLNPSGVFITSLSTNGPLPAGTVINLPLPIDPSGVVYDSVARIPVAGVTLQLLNAGTAVDTNCLFPNQQNQVTLADGMYAFDVIPGAHASCPNGGIYEIVITNAPLNYQAGLSTTLPPVAAVFDGAAIETACTVDAINASGSCEIQAQGDAPSGAEPTAYYTQFILSSGDRNIIFNHLPIDPGATGSLLLNKKVNKSEASVGDLAQYIIDVENQLAVAVLDIDIRDNLPGGFKLVENTAQIVRAGADGLFDSADDITSSATVTGADPVTFTDVDFSANETVRIRYVLRIGTGVIQGNAINRAQAFDPAGPPVSNEAQAIVVIVADPLFDKTAIIGKVFHDRDEDGYQDSANATDIRISNAYFGAEGYAAGDLAGRVSMLETTEDATLEVSIPYSKDSKAFTVTSHEGTVIKVDEAGNIVEQHVGQKARGMNAQDLQVTVEKSQGQTMIIRISNQGIHEEGIPGVRLATVGGLLIETDAYGRYHVPDVDGGRNRGRNFILKVDRVTLPKDASFTTENPRVLRITSVTLNRINFGVKLPQQQALNPATNRPVQNRSVNVSLGSIFFDTDKASIREDQRGIIDSIVTRIREYGHGHIVIEAHTDARQTAEYNIDLARRRADSVRHVLESRLGAVLMSQVKVEVAPESAVEMPLGDFEETDAYGDTSSLFNGLSSTVKQLAESILNMLIGVAHADESKPSYTLEVINFGEGKPKEKNINEEKMQYNRRVDVSMKDVMAAPATAKSRTNLPNGGVIWLVQDPAGNLPRLSINAPSFAKMQDGKLVQPVQFNVYSNYGAFIKHWEIDLYLATGAQTTPVKRLQGESLMNTQTITWDGSLDDGHELNNTDYSYVLRVYDSSGHFDETSPAALRLGSSAHYDANDTVEETQESTNEIYGENQLVKQTIPLTGSRVRLYGSDLPEGYSLHINGESVVLDAKQNFVVESILPAGMHDFSIVVTDTEGNDWNSKLSTEITDQYFFMVGLADVTIGKNNVSGNIEPLANDDRYDEDMFVDGRLAFYLKGKVKGKYLVTAQMDTEEDDIDEIFKNIHKKDPRSVFRRLDPDRYYPVYGDDSSIIDDTDSQGKMYVRVEWDKSQALWGNYNTSLTGTELSEFNRSLYGGQYIHNNTNITTFGDPKTQAQIFASEVQSAFGHNEFLGTGGSLYYLKHTDILPGSEKLWVETRQRETGRVIDKIILERGRDYEVDEIQGRIILSRPLAQVRGLTGPSIIKDSPLDGNQVYLAADYEYVPDGFSADKMTFGARGKGWVNDHIAIGGSIVHENRNSEDYQLKGVDITLKAAKGTYFKAEYAETEAEQTSANFVSTDGGLNFNASPASAGNIDGSAISLEARADLSDFTDNGKGTVGAWWK